MVRGPDTWLWLRCEKYPVNYLRFPVMAHLWRMLTWGQTYWLSGAYYRRCKGLIPYSGDSSRPKTLVVSHSVCSSYPPPGPRTWYMMTLVITFHVITAVWHQSGYGAKIYEFLERWMEYSRTFRHPFNGNLMMMMMMIMMFNNNNIIIIIKYINK